MALPTTRRSLIIRLGRADDQSAWEDFVSLYEPFLTRLVLRQGTPQRHVDDVVQTLLLAVARSVEQWESDGRPASFRRWLTTVSRNVVIRFLQQESRQISGDGGSQFLQQLHDFAATPDDAQLQRYERELILWAAERVRGEFQETSWKAFQRTVIEGESVEVAARELQVSPGSIYMSRSRIMARIRHVIRDVLE